MFETSLYHDEINGIRDVRKQKRSMTLDLDSYENKKMKMNTLLSSPDIKMLQLASPELERFIIQNSTANTLTTPTGICFPKFVTKEQEEYARGFCVALEKLHSSKSDDLTDDTMQASTTYGSDNLFSNLASITSPNIPNSLDASKILSLLSGLQNSPNTPLSNVESIISSSNKSSLEAMINNLNSFMSTATNASSGSVSSSDAFYHNVPHLVKEEPQTVPCNTPPISPAPSSVDTDCMNSRPIDMDEQECIKRERKKERNREAARKCRSRKLERISLLEDKIKEYKSQMNSLVTEKETLLEELGNLKRVITIHVKEGCHTLDTLLRDLSSQL